MNPILIFIGFMLVTANTCYATKKPMFTAMLVFGDSTVDPGNNNFVLTAFKSNHRPYGQDFPSGIPTGRFSNGLLIPDMLASSFGIKEFVPPYLDPSLSDDDLRTGVSFASAGSGLDELTTAFSGVIPVAKQVTYFKEYKERLTDAFGEEEANRIINGAFVMISAGSNDIVFNFYNTKSRKIQMSLTEYHDFLLVRLERLVKELHGLGCRTFVVSGLGPLGCVPIQITAKGSEGRKCLEKHNSETQMYNAKLKNLVTRLPTMLSGSNVTYVNTYDGVIKMIQNPQQYGFVETNKGCCGTGLVEMGPLCNAFSPVCSNPSEYLFWDGIHPSEAAYKFAAKALYTQLRV
ncbi:hypothetical protein MKW94_027939 [Papaver nudicaule]|uniref:GDSL esterase/lipase n=1 Tax=Papaver nudicaule TaxID=74823 RepID=A0AA41RJZ9_PAPNU|nr:hypothetical protein [Papaver nudicaule]